MTVDRYLFQSPYSNQIQIGRPDPSVKKEDDTSKQGNQLNKATNQTLQEAQAFQATQVKDVKPTVETQLLDTYA